MRILHTADIHLGEYSGPIKEGKNARMERIIRCIESMVTTAETERPDLILISGDVTNKSKLWGDQTLRETQIVADVLQRFSNVAPTVLLFGTGNHDGYRSYETLQKWFKHNPRVRIITKPEFISIDTIQGPVEIAAVPGFDKGHFIAQNPGISPTEANLMASQALGDIIRGLGAQISHFEGAPAILMSHYTVAGAQYDNGNVTIFSEAEVVLTPEAIDSAGFDLTCLGHIHRPQRVQSCATPTFYSGAIENLNFNDEGSEKGFWIHTLSGTEYVGSEYRQTPATEFLTVRPDEETMARYLDGAGMVQEWAADYGDKIVRVRYTVSAENSKRVDRARIERELYEAGAFWVAEVTPDRISEDLVRVDIEDGLDVESALEKWMDAAGVPEETRLELRAAARPIIAEVDAGTMTGKHNGIIS